MKQHKFASLFACLAAAVILATPAAGQLINFPVIALAPGAGSSTLAGAYGRGLNDPSGKLNSFAGAYARGAERFSFALAAGYVSDIPSGIEPAGEWTGAGAIGVHLLSDSPFQVTVQSGLGWMSVAGTPDNTSLLNIPIGVAIQTADDGPGRVWLMPRFNMLRQSTAGVSSTESKFGTSAGGSYMSEGGMGVGVALDWQMTDDGTGTESDESVFGFSVALLYAFP